jgi:hypothetical protein
MPAQGNFKARCYNIDRYGKSKNRCMEVVMDRILFVRAGVKNKLVGSFIEKGIVAVGWYRLPDLSAVTSASTIKSMLKNQYPEKIAMSGEPTLHLSEIIHFVLDARQGDLVATVDGNKSVLYLGTIAGKYQYWENSTFSSNGEIFRHILPVTWKYEVPRSKHGKYSFPQTRLKGKTTYWLSDAAVEDILNAPRTAIC